ncbi:MAG: ribosome biogenesis GTPase Der [Deltaproteobacteria bacterium]|nr:ribosome biogenesis GTPase Der [Deltaproteobacteria bacterium]
MGKSTLINKLAGRFVAVVEDLPGVTRDRIFVDWRLDGRDVVLVDTGGFDLDPDDELAREAVVLARLAVEEADVVLFICDAKDGLHPLDQEVADVLRRSGKPTLCLVNKCDPGATARPEYEFCALGMDPLPVSALHRGGFDVLEERLAALLPAEDEAETELEQNVDLKICLLGRPNVGKSSLANHLAGMPRQMVSKIAGTTRDAVDIRIEGKGGTWLLVDTPGVRRRRSIDQRVEYTGVVAALRSLERADVGLLVLDGEEGYTDQDARLAGLIESRGRGLVVLVNKTDLWEADRRENLRKEIAYGFRFVGHAPILEVSALTGAGMTKVLPAAKRIFANAGRRATTGELNRFIAEAMERQQPPVIKGRRAKIYYLTQTGSNPPAFVAFVNNPARLPNHYRKYLENQLRSRFGFDGVPLRLVFRGRDEKASGRDQGRKGSRSKDLVSDELITQDLGSKGLYSRNPSHKDPSKVKTSKAPDKDTPKKPPAKKAPGKKSSAKKASAKKTPGKKSSAKKAPGKKSSAKKAPGKKAPAKARKGSVKKVKGTKGTQKKNKIRRKGKT